MTQLTSIGMGSLAGLPHSGSIVALQLGLQFARRGLRPVWLDAAPLAALDPLERRRLGLDAAQPPVAGAIPLLQAFGERLAAPQQGSGGERDFRVGLAAFNHVDLAPDRLHHAAGWPLLVAGSTWLARVLRARGLPRVVCVPAGVDPALFHPGPRAHLFPGRFVIFAGGALGYRKGTDLVVAAFRTFHQRHPDALLVGGWGPAAAADWRALAASPHLAGRPGRAPETPSAWLVRNGIPPAAFVELGRVSTPRLPAILRDCDLALFPSRCEGGVSLLAMEALACGVPTVLAANTGHLDLAGDHAYLLAEQADLARTGGPALEGWGESSVEELLATMERAYRRRHEAAEKGRAAARFMTERSWERQAGRLLDVVQAAAAGRLPEPGPDDDYRWGLCLHRGGRLDAAREVYDAVLARAPGHLGARGDRANARRDLGDTVGAEADFRAVLAAQPGYPKALHSLGRLLRRQQRLDEAADCLRRAVAAAPTPARHWDLAFTLLLAGRYGEAWPHFEHRHAALGLRTAAPGKPRWTGQPVTDATLLVLDEQGLGDTIQFLRFLPRIPVGPGGRVLFAGKPSVLATVRRLLPHAEVVSWDERLPRSDVWVPLMSLPACLGVRQPGELPPPSPGRLVEPARVDHWRTLVRGADDRPVVGLCWRGNPEFPDDEMRSPGLSALLPLLDVVGVRFVALQVGHGRGEIGALGRDRALADLGGALEAAGADALDTLAVLESCDLVVSCCTAVAHLAGLVGRPGLVLLAHRPDWRWMLHRSDSPWYPSLELVRQPAPGDWGSVAVAAAARLAVWRDGLASAA